MDADIMNDDQVIERGREAHAIALQDTGEVINFDDVLAQVKAMPVEQKAQVWVKLGYSNVLSNILSELKNGVIDDMRKRGATVMPIPGGEISMKETTTYDYDVDVVKSIVPNALSYVPKVDKREVNKAMKLGGDIKAKLDAATRVKDVKFSLFYTTKIQVEIEK